MLGGRYCRTSDYNWDDEDLEVEFEALVDIIVRLWLLLLFYMVEMM